MSVHYSTDLNTPPSTEHALRAVKGERRVVWFMNVWLCFAGIP